MAFHSIKRYSAGFAGSNALHVKTLGFLGEMVDTSTAPLNSVQPRSC
jgi:hypothetical protein